MTDATGPEAGLGTHIVSETGLAVVLAGDGLAGWAQVVPELHVPGTDVLRASVLATWSDVLLGLLAMSAFTDRVPVTLDLSVEVLVPVRGCPVVHGLARTEKAGRGVVVLTVDFRLEGSDEVVAVGTAAFVPSPDATFRLPALAETVRPMGVPGGPLLVPLAERASCARTRPGVAVLQRREDGLNAIRTVNGALLALAAEEAVLSGAAAGAVLVSLTVRYLRAARTGPVVARATTCGSFSRVELRDSGNGDRVAVLATARTA